MGGSIQLQGLYTPLGYAQYSVAGTAKGFQTDAPSVGTTWTTAIAAGKVHQVEITPDGAIRFRLDGTDPTATVGVALAAGAQYVCDTDPTRFRFISQSGTVLVSVSYKGAF